MSRYERAVQRHAAAATRHRDAQRYAATAATRYGPDSDTARRDARLAAAALVEERAAHEALLVETDRVAELEQRRQQVFIDVEARRVAKRDAAALEAWRVAQQAESRWLAARDALVEELRAKRRRVVTEPLPAAPLRVRDASRTLVVDGPQDAARATGKEPAMSVKLSSYQTIEVPLRNAARRDLVTLARARAVGDEAAASRAAVALTRFVDRPGVDRDDALVAAVLRTLHRTA